MSKIVLILVVKERIKVVVRIIARIWGLVRYFFGYLEDLLTLWISPQSWIVNFIQIKFIKFFLFNEPSLMAESLVGEVLSAIVADFCL